MSVHPRVTYNNSLLIYIHGSLYKTSFSAHIRIEFRTTNCICLGNDPLKRAYKYFLQLIIFNLHITTIKYYDNGM